MPLEIDKRKKRIKSLIENLISEGNLEEAKKNIAEYEKIINDDIDIYSMKAVISIAEENYFQAKSILKKAYQLDVNNFDVLYNLAFLYYQEGKYNEALRYYRYAKENCHDENTTCQVEANIGFITDNFKDNITGYRTKIAFFVKPGMDSFIDDIIEGICENYETKKIIVTSSNQIDEGMGWSDVSWFEWCDELVVYGSKHALAKDKKIICRLHSYEAFTNYISNGEWKNVDKLIFVAEHIRKYVLDNINIDSSKTCVIPNGLNVENYTFKERQPGFNVAYVGYINYKKGPMLLLHLFKAIYDRDNRFKFYIAGKFQDDRDVLYYNQMIQEFGLQNSVFFEGWQDDLDKWLEDKNYIVCTSVLESQNISVMQGMCKGIKPAIHNFVGARDIYPSKLIWNTLDEAVDMVNSKHYDSNEYKDFIKKNYSFEKQIDNIKRIIGSFEIKENIINYVSDRINGRKVAESININDLTLLITCYNRGSLLKDDAEQGFKMSNQKKLIVDDCSIVEDNLLYEIENNEKLNIGKVIKNDKNRGLAGARNTGFLNIKTKYTAVLDDDDMLFVVNQSKIDNKIKRLNNDAVIVIPRYIFNLYGDGNLNIGYDRMQYHGLTSAEVLLNFFSTGEIRAFLAGSISKNEDLLMYNPNDIFKVAEDYATLSRMFANNLNKKIIVSEDLVHVRRIDPNSLSKTLNGNKLALHLLSHTITGYYCLINGFIDYEMFKYYLKNRCNLLNNIYGYGNEFYEMIIGYLNDSINESELVRYFNKLEIDINSMDEIGNEFKNIKIHVNKNNPKSNDKFSDSTQPMVSIIIPTYNQKEFLKQAIDSVLMQDYRKIEIIVADDCSTDGTDKMMEEYLNENGVRYFKNEINLRPMKNIKKALYEYATGEFAVLLDHDDYYIDKSFISKAVNFLMNNKNVSFVWANCKYLDMETGKLTETNHIRKSITNGLDYFLNYEIGEYTHIPSLLTAMFRKDAALKRGCFNEDTLVGDIFLYLKLMLEGDVGFISDHVGIYRVHKNSLSSNMVLKYDFKVIEELEVLKNEGMNMGIEKSIMDNWINFRVAKYVNWSFMSHYRNNRIEDAYKLLEGIKHSYTSAYKAVVQSIGML